MDIVFVVTCSPLITSCDVPVFKCKKTQRRYISLQTFLKLTGIMSLKDKDYLILSVNTSHGFPKHVTKVILIDNIPLILAKRKQWSESDVTSVLAQLQQPSLSVMDIYMKTVDFQNNVKTCLKEMIKDALPYWRQKLKPLILAKLASDLSLESPIKRHKHILDDEEEECVFLNEKDNEQTKTPLFNMLIDFDTDEIKDLLEI